MSNVAGIVAGLVIAVGIAAAGLNFLSTTTAPPPCPPNPCVNGEGKFSSKLCEDKADWIAVGKIHEIVHSDHGGPVFTFTIQSWDSSPVDGIEEIQFQVGRCTNAQPLPAEIDGMFRFYGKGNPATAPHLGAQYYGFEAAL